VSYKLILLSAALAACVGITLAIGRSDNDVTRKTLHSAGYSGVVAGGYSLFGCGDDFYRTRFVAIDPSGQTVNGVVCCGILKGCTIRF